MSGDLPSGLLKNFETSWLEKAGVMKYAVVIEKTENDFGAYVPDLPGCVPVADSLEEVERMIREAIQFHIEGLKQDGLPIPPPLTLCEYVDASL
jgi:predicted RNase H-like HicB family nuclease